MIIYNINDVRPECREFLEISQQRQVSQTERFCTENALNVWKHICKYE